MKKHRYQITALILSLIMITSSLSGLVFAEETDVNLGQTSEIDAEDISTKEDSTASVYASEEEMFSADKIGSDSVNATEVNKASTRTDTFEKQETAPMTASNSIPETETMDVYCGWDCSLSYISEAEVPVVFDFEGVPLSYCGDRKEVYDYDTDEYWFFFSIFEPGTYSINAVNTNTGDVLKNNVINVQPDRCDRTICVGSYDWLDIVSNNDLVFDKIDTMDIQLRDITYEDYEVDQNPYNVVSRMFLKYLVKGIEKGDYSIQFYVNDKDHPYYIATYHVVDHYYQESKIIREATCTESGSIEKKCEICGKTVTETIPATGHIWNETYTTDKEATCTEEGSESIQCSVCGEIDEETVRAIPKKEHAYGDWTVTKEATCTEEGSKEKICADCNEKVTETIPATGHIWNEEYTVDKEATYAEEGSESIHCSICDEIKEGTSKPIVRLLKPVSMLTVSGIVDKVYTGNALTQEILIKDGTTELIQDTDYTVSYENNTNAGTASVTITGKGNYTGSKTITFKILPVGWYEEGGVQYFYKSDGTKLTNGWAKNGTAWYWMDNDGKITKNKWIQTGGKWYYMTSSGAMTTGWQKIGGKWYYMNSSGAMTTGWQKIGGKWYYMNSSGAMTTGWQKIGGKWYYMNSSGVMTTGWQKIGGKWYYMKADGTMVTGRQTIGGKAYKFNSSGVWIQ